MTLNQLKNDVARLGFESGIEDGDCFIASANRALNIIYTDRPVSKTTAVTFGNPRVSLLREFIEHRCGEQITLTAKGRCISFRSSGTGECVITDSSGSSIIALISDAQPTKRLLKGEATITFRGDYYFTVSNLAVFEDVRSNNVAFVPEYTPRRELEPSDYCDDFRAFAGQPTDKDGRIADSVILRDGRISVPFSFVGDIYLTYYRTPKQITAENENAAIDISAECEPLLPLLTASFMWLDDDAAKAQYYMSLYRDSIANIKRYSTAQLDTGYRVNGWA